MEKNQENLTLGQENIGKLLVKFSIPCVMGLLISALYNIVDQIFIGNSELGFLGNAATGVLFPVICIANAFAWCNGRSLRKRRSSARWLTAEAVSSWAGQRTMISEITTT